MVDREPTNRAVIDSAPLAATITTQTAETPSTLLSDKYQTSQFSVEGFAWTIYGSEMAGSNATIPVTTGIGVRWMHWLNRIGLEGLLKSGVFGLNQAGKETSLKNVEARYHYRFFTRFPFSLARELQISLFAGGEVYRNSGLLFSHGYELLKFGTALEFPWGRSWQGGGEFTGGYGFDGSRKFEISGHLGYFIAPKWSLGVGYRVHLFEAGSAKTGASGSLPYREGYTEGYSILNYHF